MYFQGLNSVSLLPRIKELFDDPKCPPISGLLRTEVSQAVAEFKVPKLELYGLPWLNYISNGVHGLFVHQNGTRTFIHSKYKELSPTEGALSLFYGFESYFIDPKTNKDLLWDIIWWKIWILQEFQKTLPEIFICKSDADTDSVGPQWEKFQVMLQHLRVAEKVAEGNTNHFSMFTPGAPTEMFQRSERSREQYEWRKSAISGCIRFWAGVLERPIDENNLDLETRFNIGFANYRLQPNSCIDLSIADLETLCSSTGVSQIRTGVLLHALNEMVHLKSDRFFNDLHDTLTFQIKDILPPKS